MRIATLVVLATAVVFGQGDRLTPAALARQIEQELATARVPGASIAIVSGDQVFAGSYGVADAEKAAAMTPTTLVQAGSLTKLFTALAVSATLDARRIDFDANIGQFMPGLAPRAAAATFQQLLSQTSGLRDRPGDIGTDDETALASSARSLAAADFLLPGNVVFSYSNLGYSLAGAALESLSKKPFAEVLTDTVLAPLGMALSTLRPSEALERSHAAGHRLEGASTVTLRTPANDTRIWPAGYLWTNATDMSRALSALLSHGRVQGYRGLNASAVARVTTPHTPMPNVLVGGHYGYGLMIARDRGTLIYEHGGTMPGYSAMIRIAPERHLGIAILTNLDSAPLRRVSQQVMARALGLPDQPPPVRHETVVTVDEMKSQLGTYRNRGTAEIAVRDGRVVLILDGGPPFAVSRIGENRYLARPKPEIAGPEFVLQPATSSVPAYLHFALWAYTR